MSVRGFVNRESCQLAALPIEGSVGSDFVSWHFVSIHVVAVLTIKDFRWYNIISPFPLKSA